MVNALLAAAFPTKDGKVLQAGDLVKNFDFSKMNVKEVTKQDFLNCALAPSFKKLSSAEIQALDDEMKIMITGLTKQLGKLSPNDRTWDAIVSLCAQSPFLAPLDDGIARTDSLVKNSSSAFKTDGSPDSGIVKEVTAWFKKLIQDEDVLNSTKIDINVLGRIVAQSGATVDSFESFFHKTEEHTKTVIDIGVLRYPDIDNPYFKIYRIKLTAWSKSTRTLAWQEDRNGIQGEFNVRKYKPRSSVINNLTDAAKAGATKQAADILGDL
ncbi:hypothetical protein CEK26_003978 [Fusarium fujikuroi]|nr:hypothetical protein CEK27_003970 [Fusarium fujikuroi]QGI90909.1 hypothetical protein CEK26_003978 [Fusarium fujikuroi]SCN90585.1 uncharacterized protein FFE2_07011 [Fusarium fujikuroi]